MKNAIGSHRGKNVIYCQGEARFFRKCRNFIRRFLFAVELVYGIALFSHK